MMGLKPLELVFEQLLLLYGFMYLLSKRTFIGGYEKELENDSTAVKNLIKECHRLIQATDGGLSFYS